MRPARLEIDCRIEPEPQWLERHQLERVVLAVLAASPWEGASLSIILVDDEVIAEVHGEFFGDPAPTDVITFDLRVDGDWDADAHDEIAAELLISLSTAERVARAKGHAPMLETSLYVVHGLLHLLGEDDCGERERESMRRRERECFELLDLVYPF